MPNGDVNDAQGFVLTNYTMSCTSQAKPGFEDALRRQLVPKS